MVLANNKVKLQEIANTLKISKGRVGVILHTQLSMVTLFSKWLILRDIWSSFGKIDRTVLMNEDEFCQKDSSVDISSYQFKNIYPKYGKRKL